MEVLQEGAGHKVCWGFYPIVRQDETPRETRDIRFEHTAHSTRALTFFTDLTP